MFPSSVTLKLLSFFELVEFVASLLNTTKVLQDAYVRLWSFVDFFFPHFYLNRISTLTLKILAKTGKNTKKPVTNNTKEQLKTIKCLYNI